MQEEKVIFKNNRGNKLVGYYYKGKSKTLIIGCHGAQTYNSFPQAKPIVNFYHKLGFSFIRFDFTGYGESEGKISLLQRISDIDSVVEQFGKGYEEIIVSAVSLGTMTAAISAQKNKKITKLILTNGAFNFKEISLYIKFLMWSYVLRHPSLIKEVIITPNMVNPKLITIPTLVIYSDNDTIVSPKQSIDFFNMLKTKKTLDVIKNANHYSFDQQTIDQTNTIIAKWLKSFHLPR